jgi:hypothetical protein
MQDAELRAAREASHRAIARVSNGSDGTLLKPRDCHDGSIFAIKSIKSDKATGLIRESATTEINALTAVASLHVCGILREPIRFDVLPLLLALRVRP